MNTDTNVPSTLHDYLDVNDRLYATDYQLISIEDLICKALCHYACSNPSAAFSLVKAIDGPASNFDKIDLMSIFIHAASKFPDRTVKDLRNYVKRWTDKYPTLALLKSADVDPSLSAVIEFAASELLERLSNSNSDVPAYLLRFYGLEQYTEIIPHS